MDASIAQSNQQVAGVTNDGYNSHEMHYINRTANDNRLSAGDNRIVICHVPEDQVSHHISGGPDCEAPIAQGQQIGVGSCAYRKQSELTKDLDIHASSGHVTSSARNHKQEATSVASGRHSIGISEPSQTTGNRSTTESSTANTQNASSSHDNHDDSSSAPVPKPFTIKISSASSSKSTPSTSRQNNSSSTSITHTQPNVHPPMRMASQPAIEVDTTSMPTHPSTPQDREAAMALLNGRIRAMEEQKP